MERRVRECVRPGFKRIWTPYIDGKTGIDGLALVIDRTEGSKRGPFFHLKSFNVIEAVDPGWSWYGVPIYRIVQRTVEFGRIDTVSRNQSNVLLPLISTIATPDSTSSHFWS